MGKLGLGAPLTDGTPNNHGFDFFYGYNCQRQAHNLYPKHLWRNKEKVWLDNELIIPNTKLAVGADPQDLNSYAPFFQEDYAPALMQQEALNFIEDNRDGPFFLYYATPLPHVPLQVPQKYVDKYVGKFGNEDPYLGQEGYFPHRYPKAAYAAMVTYLDDQVRELISKLKEIGQYENTLIIFSSDNGPTYNGGTNSPFFDSAKPFKSEYAWGKGFVREGGIRVPMIAVWHDKIKSGTTSNLVSAFWDVLPTLAEVSGAKLPDNIDGLSFLPELLGKDGQQEDKFLYWEFPAYEGQQAVRMGQWKGIRQDIFKGNMEMELYDLSADPQELYDVAKDHADIVAKIENIMKESHQPADIERFKISQLGDI